MWPSNSPLKVIVPAGCFWYKCHNGSTREEAASSAVRNVESGREKTRMGNMNKARLKTAGFILFGLLGMFLAASSFLEANVNLSMTSGESFWPAVAVNSAGDIMVVWTEWSSGQVFYRINRNGKWSDTKNAGVVYQQAWSNQLDVDSHGTFHLTYADGRSSYSRDIYYSYFTGSNWSTPERLYASPYNSAWNKMDIDKNDDIHVAWYHSNVPKEQPVSSDIVTMWKKRMGTWPATYQNISRSRQHESIHPAIGVLNGNVYTCWMEAEAPRRLYFCEKINKSWRSPVELLRSGYYPDMVVDDSGNVHIVYSLRDKNFHYISRMGGRWRSQEIISNGQCPLQFGDIAHKNNVLVAAWIQGSDGNWSVYATGKVVGDKWAIPVKIADTPGGGDGNKHVQVALDNRNCAHFVWEGIGQGGRHDIFYEKYCVDTPADATFIEVDNSYLGFHTDGSSNPASQTFRVRASGQGSIHYTVTKDRSWLSVSPTQGSSAGEWDTITVAVDTSGLSDGSYSGTVKITDPEAYNSPVEVGISLTVGDDSGGGGGDEPSSSFIEVDKVNMEFSMEEGANPAPKSFNIRAAGGQSLNYAISTNKDWLVVFPNEGTATSQWASIAVSIEAEGLAPGTHRGRIDIQASGVSSTTSIFVTLTIEKKQVPSIQLNKTYFYFWGYANGDDPAPSSFQIRNSGAETLSYKITPNKEWIKVSPSQGTSTGEWDVITISPKVSSLGINRHRGTIQVSAPGAEHSPQSITVEFDVFMPPQPYPPLDVSIKRMNHEGLLFQEYKTKVDWKSNPRNSGLFDILKYRIYRRNQYQVSSPWIYAGEVGGNVFTFYDGGFATKQERNKYIYTVTAVDGEGKESLSPPPTKSLAPPSLKEGAGKSRSAGKKRIH